MKQRSYILRKRETRPKRARAIQKEAARISMQKITEFSSEVMKETNIRRLFFEAIKKKSFRSRLNLAMQICRGKEVSNAIQS